jgi:hypothetical protein
MKVMGAADATLSEALTLLRTQWATETEGVLNGKYAFWLGSGISRQRYPDVGSLLDRLLNRLQAGIDHSNPACPYRRALLNVLDLTTIAAVDITRPPAEWPDFPDIIGQLRNRYSEALDVELCVNGTAKELFWDVLELQHVYGDPQPPDAEHRFLALLIEEGVVSELVTTNWDPLIELAAEACHPAGVQRIRIVARSEEIAGSRDAGTARLSKIHGCARKALQDPSTYRPFLVITKNQIERWCTLELQQPLRELVQTILREKFAFFIGLSGQDHNLHHVCIAASLGRGDFPTDPSRVLFAALGITAPQHSILKAVYRCYLDHAPQIDAKAALPLYGKPLLGSLYLLCLKKKISILVERATSDFSSIHRVVVELATGHIEDLLRSRYDSIADPTARWRRLADEVPSFVGRFLRIYRRQETLPTPEAYECLSTESPSQMIANPIASEPDLPWLFLAVALILEGEHRSMWTAMAPKGRGGEDGQLVIKANGRSARVFLINRSDIGFVNLIRRGLVDPSGGQRVVVLYPNEKESRWPRRGSPLRSMPGRPSEELLEFWLKDIIEDGQTLDELVKEFERRLVL